MINLLILSSVLLSALGALFCRQTIYALLSLMTTFITSALFFFQLQIYFIGSILIIVYVGAITMLFLYVIMFLDIKKHIKMRKGSNKRFFKFMGLLWCILSWFIALTNSESELLVKNETNSMLFSMLRQDVDVLAISQTFYTYYGQLVLVIGYLLFIIIVIATDIAHPRNSSLEK